MKTLRKLRMRAPRTVRRRDFDISDIALADSEHLAGHDPTPEAVFDRSTGPWDRRGVTGGLGGIGESGGLGGADEET